MTDAIVVAAGIAAIVWVNWYFFVAGRGSAVAAEATGGVQQVRIRVAGGYEPREVRVRAGERVRLVFEREGGVGGGEEVVFPELGIRRFLTPREETVVEFTPERPGAYEFTCGMGMLRGRVLVEER